ncbi:MAG: hypothetical protein NWQ54_08030 [Paraglaciecola sp.]|nr:hypothetical protein [Paraglaciecola sp.]
MIYNIRRHCGFSLIEVLIASLMIMLGVTGYVTLQSEFVLADSKINLRNIALRLAQEKFDDLASFSQVTSDVNGLGFNDIQTNTGGELASGQVEVALGNNAANIRTFTRTWLVNNRYFVDLDNDSYADTWVDSTHPSLIMPLPTIAGQKSIRIQIDWLDYQGDNQSIILAGSLTPVAPSRSLLAFSDLPSSNKIPQVVFTPSSIPDSHTVEVGNNEFKQSASPIIVSPERIELSIEDYRHEDGQYIKSSQADFTTVSCRCELAGMGQGMTPSFTTISNGKSHIEAGQLQNKMTGTPSSTGQSTLCSQCCRDHHDSTQTIADERFYRNDSGVPHSHFQLVGGTGYQQALIPGDQYDEACRFRRVDGYFVLYPDWHLVELVAFSPDYFLNPSNLTAYSAFSQAVMSGLINHASLPTKPINRDVDAMNGGGQLTVRGIYLDPLTTSDRSLLQAKIANGDADWLALTPFYDVNLTLLANWSTADPSIAVISNEPLSPFPSNTYQYYQEFSRGELTIISSGSTQISASASVHNSTMAGVPPITPTELATVKKDDSVLLH